MVNNFFTICSFFYSLMLTIIYFNRKKIKSIETRIYSKMIVANFLNVISAIINAYTIIYKDKIPIINDFVGKSLLVLFITWELFFTIYIIAIALKNKERINTFFDKYKIYYGLFYVLIIATIFILPLYYHNEENVVYSYGPSANLIYVLTAVLIFCWIIVILKNREILKSKKLIPVIVFVILTIVVVIIQKINPGLLLITATETFITVLMYFTIENPDVNMLNEMSKNKELMEQGYEDKYNFLFEMTQEARSPLVNISNLSNALRMEEDPERIKTGLLTLNNMVRQLDFSINNVLNISSLDVSKLKIVNNKYELDKLCHDLEVRIKPVVKDTVKFTLSMPQQLPVLYGDYMKIRQILYSLLINACNNTATGSINMKVNLIEKYDVARLIFNISDTGPGMPIEKINDILSATGSLDQQEIDNLEKKEFNVKMCQKVVKIMGGNLMIKSNIGEGTEVILTIDQKVYHEKDTSILNQYESDIANYRKVLIVSQNKKVLNVIKRKLSDNHITYSNLYYGADAIDRIKAGKKFDFILVDDEMAEMSGFMTFKGMREVNGFNTPVIIMLGEDKENIKEHYLEDGFKDYLLLDNLDNELDRIIGKY